jgi:AraC family transcriptional regulator, transcriptional activator of the genes for pyochelin and ferripyochelin receptors
MIYHHLFDNPSTKHFLLKKESNRFFLHYARKGAMQLHYDGLTNQLLPEEYFQVYYITDAQQQFEFKQSGKYSLLSISFTSKWLEPMKNHFRTMATFLEKAAKKEPAALFSRPQPLTVENRRLLNDIFSDTWRAHHIQLIVRLILLPSLKKSASGGQPTSDSDTIYSIAEWILMHIDEPVNLPFLTKKFLINEFKLKSEFKKVFGSPVISFQRSARIEKAKQMLLQKDISIGTIARAVGFDNTNYFSDFFRRETNSSPTEFRNTNAFNETASLNDPA